MYYEVCCCAQSICQIYVYMDVLLSRMLASLFIIRLLYSVSEVSCVLPITPPVLLMLDNLALVDINFHPS